MTDADRHSLECGVRSHDAVVLRRGQTLLASARGARGARAPQIAQPVGCDDRTVLDARHACTAVGLAALRKGASRPRRTRLAFGLEQTERLRALLHQSPRAFGHPTSVWTLDLAAAVSGAKGRSPRRVSGATIRPTLQRLGVGWRHATPRTGSPVSRRRTPAKQPARPPDAAERAAC